MKNRKDAYQEVFKAHGEKIRIQDRKGTWIAGDLLRTARYGPNQADYHFYITLEANREELPKASDFPISGRIFIRHQEGMDVLKRRIREEIGYTPTPDVLQDMWARFLLLRSAYDEEDRYYAGGDRAAAEAVIEALFRKAGQRFEQGENLMEEHRRRSYPIMENYLTRGELREAREAQKVINGHAFIAHMTALYEQGHLAIFNRRIRDLIDEIRKRREWEEVRSRDRMLQDKLETDVEFRKLVAHALAASREIRTSKVEYELIHRLFGYSRNLDEYRDRISRFDELIKPYRIRYYDAQKLVTIGKAYLSAGGMLPVAQAPHERLPGRFYYMDDVHDGIYKYQVRGSGTKYVQTEKGGQVLKRTVRHFEKVQLIDRPANVDQALFNVLTGMHNRKALPLAHRRGLQDVARSLISFKTFRVEDVQRGYEERRDHATNAFERDAYQLIAWAIRRERLQKQVEALESLMRSGTHQSSYAAAIRELKELEEKLQPYLPAKDLNPCM